MRRYLGFLSGQISVIGGSCNTGVQSLGQLGLWLMLFSELKYCFFSFTSNSVSFWDSESSRMGRRSSRDLTSHLYTQMTDDAENLLHHCVCTIRLEWFIDCYSSGSKFRLQTLAAVKWKVLNGEMSECPDLVILICKVSKIVCLKSWGLTSYWDGFSKT